MEHLDGDIENLNENIEDSIIDLNEEDTKSKENSKIELKDAKMEKDNTFVKPEDLDGLQMLRLVHEDKILPKKDIVPKLEEPSNQQTLLEDCTISVSTKGDEFNHELECFEMAKPMVNLASHVSQNNSSLEEPKPSSEVNKDASNFHIKKNIEKHKGVEKIGTERKPSLVKKEVSDLHGLVERQQKILQDFHVKFALEGVDDEEDDEAKASKHYEFIGLKKRLEEEEKIYAGCALGEASNISQINVVSNVNEVYNPLEDINSLEPAQVVAKATMDGVINNFAKVAICRQDLNQQEDMKPLPRSQHVSFAMKGLIDDDGLCELQEYTNREGNTRCQYCCRKAGKQIDEGDESDVYMTNSSYSILNVVCPISGISVVELDDPVRSEECEHIYDRASALNYIANMAKDGFCLCASPGCRALLAESKLVVDTRLWQDIEELRQIKATMWESRMLQDLANVDDSDDD